MSTVTSAQAGPGRGASGRTVPGVPHHLAGPGDLRRADGLSDPLKLPKFHRVLSSRNDFRLHMRIRWAICSTRSRSISTFA